MKYLSVVLVIIIFSCSESNEIKEFYENGNIKFVREIDEQGMLHGKGTTYYESGQLKSTEFWHQNALDGEISFYYESGELRGVANYNMGRVITRSMIKYHKNGKIYSAYDTLAPIQRIYFDNGDIQEKQLYNDGDSLLEVLKFDKRGKITYASPNTAFINFSTEKLQEQGLYEIELNKDYDQWQNCDLLVFVSLGKRNIDVDTIPVIDEDLGYYRMSYELVEPGEYDFDLFFLNKELMDTSYLYSRKLVVK